MNKIFSFFQAIRLRQVVTVFLAGVFLMLSTACSGAAQAKSPVGSADPNVPGQAQPYEGGMNNFSDVDTNRVDLSKSNAKAKALKDRVERNLDEKRIDSVDQYVENYKSGAPLGERTKKFGKDIQRGTENATEDLKYAADRGSDKVGRGLDYNADKAGQAVENVKDNTRAAGKDLVRDVKRAADKVTE